MYKFYSCLLLIVFFFFLASPFCFSFDDSSFIWSDTSSFVETSSTPISGLELKCESAILIEQSSGKVLYEKNSHEQLRPASVTKIMSILLIMESLDSGIISLTDKVPCSQAASDMGGSQIWLDPRETLTVDEMLKAICVASANDCTVAMAEYIAGSQEAFVEKMNKKAQDLGMNDTCFKNCHGLDTDGHVTSSYDISLMSKELLNNHPNIIKYTTIWMDSLRDGKSELVNTNKLVRNYKGCTGLKTGSTGLALYNLSASATRDNLSLIAVILKAPTTADRFADAQKLLDYGFANYSYKQFAKKGDILKKVSVNKGVFNSVNAVYSSDSGSLLKKNEDKNIEEIVNVKDSISAPIYKDQELGQIDYLLNGEIISSVKIVADNDVKKLSLINIFNNLFKAWGSLLRIPI